MRPDSLHRLTAICRSLARLYPPAFRERFADDMSRLFAFECERVGRAEGSWGIAMLAMRSFAGMVTAAMTERCASAIRRAGRPGRNRRRSPRRRRGDAMNALLHDIRYGVRNFVKTPSFAVLAVVTLALGIAVNTTIFSLISTVLFADLPVQDPDRFVFLWAQNEKVGENRSMLSLPDVLALRGEVESFESVSVALQDSLVLTGEDEPRQLRAFRVSDNFFETWGIGTILGRGFLPGEDRPGASPVTVLSHGLWERQFGSDPDVIGRSLQLDGESRTVVGVLSPQMEFGDISTVDLWVPLGRDLGSASWDDRVGLTQAVLRPDATLDNARRETALLASRLAQDHPATHGDWSLVVSPVSEELLDDEDDAMVFMLIICVAFVLLIACANVANMMMARATSRSKEVAVRVAIGANRPRLLRQFLTEGFLLSLTAGLAGLVLARGLLDLLVAITSEQQWIYRAASLDQRVLLFTLSISLVTPFLFSLIPALRASRPDLTLTLKEGGRSSTARAGMRSRRWLVGAQVSMALMLMVVTGLLVASVIEFRRQDLGFEPEGVLAVGLNLPRADFPGDDEIRRFSEELTIKASETPGVAGAAILSPRPLSFETARRHFRIEGAPAVEEDWESPFAYVYRASPGFMAVLEMRLLSGRSFERGDSKLSYRVALVNETAAQRYWPDGGSPLGRRVQLSEASGDDDQWIEIVGVVGDIIQLGRQGRTDAVPQIYFPFAQDPTPQMALLVRSPGEPSALTGVMRQHLRGLGQPVGDMATLTEIHGRLFASANAVLALFIVFATFALVMASMGIYGVMSYAVSQQEHEIGIRMALGANAGDVLRRVVGQGVRLVLAGSAVGMVGAFFLGRMLAGVGFGVKSIDPLIFVSVPILLTLVALVANYLPAHRATRIDPVATLRTE